MDALSRQCDGEDEEEKELGMVARPLWQDFREIVREVEVDEFLQKLMEEIRRDPNTHPTKVDWCCRHSQRGFPS